MLTSLPATNIASKQFITAPSSGELPKTTEAPYSRNIPPSGLLTAGFRLSYISWYYTFIFDPSSLLRLGQRALPEPAHREIPPVLQLMDI